MSSHPPGLRFTSYSSSSNLQQSNNNGGNNTLNSQNSMITKNMQPQPQQGTNKKSTSTATTITPNTNQSTTNNSTVKHQFTTANSLSGSETDISTSTENLSMEQRYVLRHTPRVEPQGQENLQDNSTNANENASMFCMNFTLFTEF